MATLSQNKDPKFQNSKFLQFLSKMSQGEVILEGNQVGEWVGGIGNDVELLVRLLVRPLVRY